MESFFEKLSGLSEQLSFRESQRLLTRAVEASSNGIVVTDPNRPDNPIVYVNPAFEELTGYPAGDILGQNCRFLQGADRDQQALAELREAIREGRECRVVLKNYRRNGTLFWNELYVSPVYDEEGRLVNFVGVQNDVTGRREAEQERERQFARTLRAQEETEQVQRRLGLLTAADLMLSSSLDYDTVMDRISRLFVPEFADWCLLHVLEDGDLLNPVAARHADPQGETLARELQEIRGLKDGVAGVLRTGRSSLEAGPPDRTPAVAADESRAAPPRLAPRSWMFVPLVARGRMLGVITLASCGAGYTPEDLSLAESLTYRCALALENARLYREHSYIVHTLQRGLLLQEVPEIPGVEVGVEYLSVRENNEVGGDFYDLIDTRYDGWLCLLGDASGKGARAAALTALILYTLRAVAFQGDRPAEILAALNEAMIRHNTDNQFCTAVCVRVEPREDGSADLTLGCGGHPLPLLRRTDGVVEEVGEPGRAIGVFEDLELDDCRLVLGAGDTLVLYTDGVTEARAPDGTFFGEERLRSVLAACDGVDAAAVGQRIKEAVEEHRGGSPSDDVAILVLRVPEGA